MVSDRKKVDRRYAAFISYSHKDEAVARWLHRKLEAYRVPRALVGREERFGVIPKRIGKVFRDREEFAAGGELKAEIEAALDRADALVVLCSNSSARSRYVDAEIEYFRQLGGANRIVPVILNGEPPACFPSALNDGRERLGADFRKGRDERDGGLIKVLSGILGVSMDELVQRERIARRRRMRAIAALAAVFFGLALLASWFGWQAEQRRAQVFDTLARTFAERAWDAIDRGEYYLAARYALAGWHAAETNEGEMRSVLARVLYDTGESAVLEEQGDVVWSAMYSPDGKQILTACRDGVARMWDASTRRQVLAFDGEKYFMSRAVMDPTGRRVVTVSGDIKTGFRILLWNISTKEIIAELSGSDVGLDGATYSSDGALLVTIDGTDAMLWDAVSGARMLTLRGHESDIGSAALSRDGARVLTAATDGSARLWDAATGRELLKLTVAPQDEQFYSRLPSRMASFSPDGTKIVTVLGDETARVWDATNGTHLAALEGKSVDRAAFGPEGTQIIAVNHSKGIAYIFEAASGKERSMIGGADRPIKFAAFMPDGARVVTISASNIIRIWDAANGIETSQLWGHLSEVTSISFSSDGTRMLSTSWDSTTRIWSTPFGRELHAVRDPDGIVLRAQLNDEGTQVLGALAGGALAIWSLSTHQPPTVMKVDRLDVELEALSPDRRLLVATVYNDAGARVLDVRTGKEVAALRGQWSESAIAAWQRKWRWPNLPPSLPPGFGPPIASELALTSLAFNPDGTRIVAGAMDRTARVWDAASGRELIILKGHDDVVLGATHSYDGKRIVTASLDKTARVWDAATGRQLVALLGHENQVNSARFNFDGTRVVTTSTDRTVRIWNASNGEEVMVFRHHDDPSFAAFNTDGSRVVVAPDPITIVHTVMGRVLARLPAQQRWLHGEVFHALEPPAAYSRPEEGYNYLSLSEVLPITDSWWQPPFAHANFSSDDSRLFVSYADGSVSIWDVSRTTQRMAQLTQDACSSFLTGKQRHFAKNDVGADLLIREIWLTNGLRDRDVCEGVAGIAPLPPDLR